MQEIVQWIVSMSQVIVSLAEQILEIYNEIYNFFIR